MTSDNTLQLHDTTYAGWTWDAAKSEWTMFCHGSTKQEVAVALKCYGPRDRPTEILPSQSGPPTRKPPA